MDDKLRYHQQEIERFKRSGDWSSLVRHFIGHRGYQPALDAAISVLDSRAGSGGLLEDQVAPVVDLLKDWRVPGKWEGFGVWLPKLRNSGAHATLVLLNSFRNAASVVALTAQIGDDRTIRTLLDSLASGIAIAKKENELAIVAVLIDAAAEVLSALGRQEEAVDLEQEAVVTCRKLAIMNRAAFLPTLADSLNNLAATLSGLGRHEDAFERAQEAVNTYRELACKDRAAFLPDLAMSLNNLAVMFSKVGGREEALTRSEEAATAYRELAGRDRGAFLSDLAMSLNNLANRLSEIGRHEDALDRAAEAVTAYRELTGKNRAAFLPDLAMSLNNMAAMLSELGRREE